MFKEKSIFIWNNTTIGTPEKIYAYLVQGGFEGVYLHSTATSNWATASRVELAFYLKSKSLKVYGASAVYGVNANLEGLQAADLVNKYNLDGFVFDAESAFDSKENPDSNAVKLLVSYKSTTSKPSAWCWWSFYQSQRGIPWHPKKVLVAAMNYADVGMPMAYWNWGNDISSMSTYTDEVFKQWQAVTNKPIIPIGRAYNGDGGIALPETMLAFESKVRNQYKVQGISWWSLQHCLDKMDTFSRMPGFENQEIKNIYKATVVINVRKEPSFLSEVVGRIEKDELIEVLETKESGDYMWARHSKGWSAMYLIGNRYLTKM